MYRHKKQTNSTEERRGYFLMHHNIDLIFKNRIMHFARKISILYLTFSKTIALYLWIVLPEFSSFYHKPAAVKKTKVIKIINNISYYGNIVDVVHAWISAYRFSMYHRNIRVFAIEIYINSATDLLFIAWIKHDTL